MALISYYDGDSDLAVVSIINEGSASAFPSYAGGAKEAAVPPIFADTDLLLPVGDICLPGRRPWAMLPEIVSTSTLISPWLLAMSAAPGSKTFIPLGVEPCLEPPTAGTLMCICGMSLCYLK